MGNRPIKSSGTSRSEDGLDGGRDDDRPKKGGKRKSSGRRLSTSSAPDDDSKENRSRSYSSAEPGQAKKGRDARGKGRGNENGPDPEVKIFRSYSNLTDAKHSGFEPEPLDIADVKVYRRSAANASSIPLDPVSRTMSLPRGFGKTRSSVSPGKASTATEDVPVSAASTNNRDPRTSTMPFNRTSSLRMSASSAQSYQSSVTGSKVTRDDFADALDVRTKLKSFESRFIRSFMDQFSRIPPVTQISALTVAVRLPHDQSHAQRVMPISMWDYLRDEFRDIPADIHTEKNTSEFVICIPQALFSGIAHVRGERAPGSDVDEFVIYDWTKLTRDVVMCVVAEAASEISRIYEYQVALLGGDTSVQLVADHCADRALSYLIPNIDPAAPLTTARLDRNSIVHGVVRGSVSPGRDVSRAQPPKHISVIVGDKKELKWNVYDIFSRPGLRRDVILIQDDVPGPDEDDRCPWTFHTSTTAETAITRGAGGTLSVVLPPSDHMLYGYRGQVVDWDYVDCVYRLNSADERRFVEELAWRYDDFHRLYVPLKWLIGAKLMKKYCLEQARNNSNAGGMRPPSRLDQYLLSLVEHTDYTRDFIIPVYRPLEPFDIPGSSSGDLVDLRGVDMPRITVVRGAGGAIKHNENISNDKHQSYLDNDFHNQSHRYSNGDPFDPSTDNWTTSTMPRNHNLVSEPRSEAVYVNPPQSQLLAPGDFNRRFPEKVRENDKPRSGEKYVAGTRPQSTDDIYSTRGKQPVADTRNSMAGNVQPVDNRYSSAGRGPTVDDRYSIGGRGPTVDDRYLAGGRGPTVDDRYSTGGHRPTPTVDDRYLAVGRGPTPTVNDRYLAEGRGPTVDDRYLPAGRGTTVDDRYSTGGRGPTPTVDDRYSTGGRSQQPTPTVDDRYSTGGRSQQSTPTVDDRYSTGGRLQPVNDRYSTGGRLPVADERYSTGGGRVTTADERGLGGRATPAGNDRYSIGGRPHSTNERYPTEVRPLPGNERYSTAGGRGPATDDGYSPLVRIPYVDDVREGGHLPDARSSAGGGRGRPPIRNDRDRYTTGAHPAPVDDRNSSAGRQQPASDQYLAVVGGPSHNGRHSPGGRPLSVQETYTLTVEERYLPGSRLPSSEDRYSTGGRPPSESRYSTGGRLQHVVPARN